jgi:signal transduction histidine kinase
MDFLLDFRPSAVPDGGHLLLRETRGLLACYQFALGHELPNGLVALQGLARLLVQAHGDGQLLDDEARALLERLARSAQRLDEQARRLAEVGRLCREIEEAPGPPRASAEEVAREAVAELKLQAPGPAEFRVEGPLPTLAVLPRSLHAVLVELLRNAARSGRPGRAVEVVLGGAEEGTEGEVWVRDNGRGMTAAQLEQALGRSPSGAPPGAAGGPGVGWLLVRQVVARWGGSARVLSEPGRGTTVRLRASLGPKGETP